MLIQQICKQDRRYNHYLLLAIASAVAYIGLDTVGGQNYSPLCDVAVRSIFPEMSQALRNGDEKQ